MTVGDIIKAVRWCYDEEQLNSAGFGNASANDNTLMDNIIKSKIGDAVRWICLYCAPELLGGTDTVGTNTGIVYEGSITTHDNITDTSAGIVNGAPDTVSNNRFVLPSNYVRLLRVRGNTWHRAVRGESLLKEDSDEYLQLHDPTCAYATTDRPQAALIEKARKELECWPSATTFDFTCIVTPAASNYSPTAPDSDTVAIPPLARTAFIYYLAFLVLSAYEDSRAARMLEIAKMNTGRNG